MRGVTIIRGLTTVVGDSTTVPIIAMFVVSAFARGFEKAGVLCRANLMLRWSQVFLKLGACGYSAAYTV